MNALLNTDNTARPSANDDAIAAWNGVLFDKFCRFRHLVTVGLGRHGAHAIERCELDGRRVIDLGAGFGDASLELGRRAAQVVGVDAAPRFVEEARRAAAAAGAHNVRHVVADVQTGVLGGPYELAFSRFGTQFFAQPVAALRNVARCLVAHGGLCMVVWRRREDNPALHLAERIARDIVPEPPPTGAPTCGPGPFSMADADVVGDQLLLAGFEQISFERHDTPLCIGRDLDEAVEFALELGPAGERLRLSPDGARLRPTVARALADAFSPLLAPDGIWLGSSTWIVTARRA
jgi:SAM-dependent methyltransferase